MYQGELTAGIWEEKSAAIQYADYSFIMTRHQLKQQQTSALPRNSSASDVTSADVTAAATAAVTNVNSSSQQAEDESSRKYWVMNV